MCGTTGYEFANDLTGLFVDPAAEEQLTELYGSFTGEQRRFGEIAHEAKLEQALTTFEPEVDWLRAELGDRGSELDLPRALSSFGVYRTYVDPDTGEVDRADRDAIADAQLPAELAALLTLEERGKDAFVIRFQQTTPPVTAKGVEDTAFYRYNRLLCLNEVGSDPVAGRSRSTSSTNGTSSEHDASRSSCWRRRRTTPSAAAMHARA